MVLRRRQWPIYVILITLFTVSVVSTAIIKGTIISPFIVLDTSSSRRLQPEFLSVPERKILAYINGEMKTEVAIKTVIILFIASFIVRLSIHTEPLVFLWTAANLSRYFSSTGFMLIVGFLISSYFIVAGTLYIISYNKWDSIQLNVEPWPLNEPIPQGFIWKKARKVDDYQMFKEHLMGLSIEDDSVKDFLATHPYETLYLFASAERYSIENLEKIAALENPNEYFDFLESISSKSGPLARLSIGYFLEGLEVRLEEEPERYYGVYEKLFMKADGDFLNVIGKESFNEFFLDYYEFVLDKLEQNPKWRKTVEKMGSIFDQYSLNRLVGKDPPTAFGREVTAVLEKFLDKKPKRIKSKRTR